MNDKLIVFDLAGTTVKDTGGIVNKAFQDALKTFDVEVTPEEINQYMGMAKPLAIKNILSNHNVFDNDFTVNSIHHKFVRLMQDFYRDDLSVEEVNGTSDTFEYLKNNNYKLCIDTGFSKDITDIILNRMKWIDNGLVISAVSSDEVKQGRPYPYMIFELIQRIGIKSVNDTYKVGDTPSDLEEGWNAGCGLVFGVCEGSHTEKQLDEHKWSVFGILKVNKTILIPNVTYLKNLL